MILLNSIIFLYLFTERQTEIIFADCVMLHEENSLFRSGPIELHATSFRSVLRPAWGPEFCSVFTCISSVVPLLSGIPSRMRRICSWWWTSCWEETYGTTYSRMSSSVKTLSRFIYVRWLWPWTTYRVSISFTGTRTCLRVGLCHLGDIFYIFKSDIRSITVSWKKLVHVENTFRI